MTTSLSFWGCDIPEPKVPPAERLEWALELARERFGPACPAVVYVHPLTVVETPAPEGVELVERAEVGRFGYWFPTGVDR
jgi:hypothetical protein